MEWNTNVNSRHIYGTSVNINALNCARCLAKKARATQQVGRVSKTIRTTLPTSVYKLNQYLVIHGPIILVSKRFEYFYLKIYNELKN